MFSIFGDSVRIWLRQSADRFRQKKEAERERSASCSTRVVRAESAHFFRQWTDSKHVGLYDTVWLGLSAPGAQRRPWAICDEGGCVPKCTEIGWEPDFVFWPLGSSTGEGFGPRASSPDPATSQLRVLPPKALGHLSGSTLCCPRPPPQFSSRQNQEKVTYPLRFSAFPSSWRIKMISCPIPGTQEVSTH